MRRRYTAGVIIAIAAVIISGGHWLGRQGADAVSTVVAAPVPPVMPPPAMPPPVEAPVLAAPVMPAAIGGPVIAGPVAVAALPGPFGSRLSTGTSTVALTFDDGPDPRWTPVVLDLLRQNGARATFCLVGVNVRAFPGLVRRIVAEGHTLCNHTWGHEVALGTWPVERIRDNLARTNSEILRALPGAPIPYFRHPGGAWTNRAVAVAASLGMASIHWDVDPQDWRRPGAGAISVAVSGGTRPGSIVLLHDGGGDRSATVAACRFFLPYLRGRFSLMALPTPPVNGRGRGGYQQAH